jgi:hypothetical protein
LAYLCVGNTDRARAGFGEALRAYEEIGDQRFHARCLAYLGHVGRYRFRCPPQQHGRAQGQEHGT